VRSRPGEWPVTAVHASIADVLTELAQSDERALQSLFELLRIPSVSADVMQRPAMHEASRWIARAAAAMGFDVEVCETAGAPVVIAEWRKAGPAAPTALIYGHYDVQPPEPLTEWHSDPFEPEIRDRRLYARGATDDKGQFFVHLTALQAWLTATGRLPVNVVVLVEGEEEVGSPSLPAVIETHAHRLRADAVVISDGPMLAAGLPTIETSLRGHLGLQIDIQGPAQDLHSGEYGGAVVNPANALCRIVADLHDAHGRIAVPGFYDRVAEVTALERRAIESLPVSEATVRHEAGVSTLAGENGFSTFERLWRRPSGDVSGLLSGYTGEGGKSVIPSRAMAKVGFRLVPDQDPDEIERLVASHISAAAPDGVEVRLTRLGTALPWRMAGDSAVIQAAVRAARRVFGREPVFVGGGGSIPVVPALARTLDAPVLLCGFGQPGENAHAPNEWLSLEHFRLGRAMSATLWAELASI
jgi:acetylornithine deacetylase/succinyl-diaminopimelate desuccinylase-like protein